jgi:hypothetical protein
MQHKMIKETTYISGLITTYTYSWMFSFDYSLNERVAWRQRRTNSGKPLFKIQVFSLQQRKKISDCGLFDSDATYSVRCLLMLHFHGKERKQHSL